MEAAWDLECLEQVPSCFLQPLNTASFGQVQHTWGSNGLHLPWPPEKLPEANMVQLKTRLAAEGIVLQWSPVLTSK